MIIYNVQRRWFPMKADADTYRVGLGLPPKATAKIEVNNRDDLAALLNALCEAKEAPDVGATTEIVDRAYVPVDTDIPACVPAFLRKAYGY